VIQVAKGNKTDEETEGWRQLPNQEARDLYSWSEIT